MYLLLKVLIVIHFLHLKNNQYCEIYIAMFNQIKDMVKYIIFKKIHHFYGVSL